MPQVEIPADLYEKVERAAAGNGSLGEYVRQALCEKVEREEDLDRRRREFSRLSAEIRKGMDEQGVTEEEILEDFERWRDQQWKLTHG